LAKFSPFHIYISEGYGSQKGIIMAQFTNQAQLSYGNVVTNSNIAVGEITQALSITKTALSSEYSSGDTVSYVVSIVNSSPSTLNGLSLADDLGAYQFGETSVVPLDYVDGSVKYYLDGILQSAPTVSVGTGVIFSGINIGAGQNAIIAYEGEINGFASSANLPVIEKICPVDGDTERQHFKELLRQEDIRHRGVYTRILGALERSGVDGWKA
jgi:uncharacterized repeat protein (TIGR01451 family)